MKRIIIFLFVIFFIVIIIIGFFYLNYYFFLTSEFYGFKHIPANTLCKATTGEQMTVAEARQIAKKSKCGERGTIGLSAECDVSRDEWNFSIEGARCAGTCAVNIKNKTAETHWMCLGAL